jgi:hypothetical protein
MDNGFFHPRGVVSTCYILPAAAAISCGAKLHDYKVTGEEPCVRMAFKEGGKTAIKTIFQFQEVTSKGEPVKKLLEAFKQMDFGRFCPLPDSHVLVIARKALHERSGLHRWFEKLITEPVTHPLLGFGTTNTRMAATLSCLGNDIIGARRISEKHVAFYFQKNAELVQLVAAFNKPALVHDLHEEHPLYHMRGALYNREELVALLKRASTRVEVKQGGKRFYLPLNASKEKLTHMVQKLNQ